MIRKQSTDPVFEQVSVRLLSIVIGTLPLLSKKSLVKFLRIIAPKTGKIPQKYHSMSNFREASG